MIPRLVLLCALLPVYCNAATPTVACPDTITVTQQLATEVPGWRAILDGAPHLLANITFYDGPPEEQASLVGDSNTKSPGHEIATWRFSPTSGRSIWLSCSYAGTAVTLAKSLPVKTSACTVTHNTRQRIGGMPVIEKIACK